VSNNDCHFTGTTNVKEMNTWRDRSSDSYKRLAEMAWT